MAKKMEISAVNKLDRLMKQHIPFTKQPPQLKQKMIQQLESVRINGSSKDFERLYLLDDEQYRKGLYDIYEVPINQLFMRFVQLDNKILKVPIRDVMSHFLKRAQRERLVVDKMLISTKTNEQNEPYIEALMVFTKYEQINIFTFRVREDWGNSILYLSPVKKFDDVKTIIQKNNIEFETYQFQTN